VPETTYYVSTLYVQGIMRALHELGMQEVIGLLPPDAQQMFLKPHLKPWWEGSLIETMGPKVLEMYGEARIIELGAKTVSLAVSRVTRPLIQITAVLERNDLVALLKHFGEFSAASVKNIEVAFRQTSPTSGVLSIKYPHIAPATNGLFWHGGIIGVLRKSSAKNAHIASMKQHAGTFDFEIVWSA
jgi:hypothetical protein